MKFHTEELDEASWRTTENLLMISDDIIDHGRWAVTHKLVFRDMATGLFYDVGYTIGATECQDCEKWNADGDNMVECREVFPVEMTIIQYLPKKDASNA